MLSAATFGAAPAQQSPTPAPTAPGRPVGRGNFVPPEPADFSDHAGWTSIFDGSTMNGWDANPAVWSIAGGALTAASVEGRRMGTSYLIYKEPLGDFELKFEYKLDGEVHSGIAYRSWIDPARAATLGPAAPAPTLPGGGRPAGAPAGAGQAPTGTGAGSAAGAAASAPGGATAPAGRAGGRGVPPDVPIDPRWTLYGPGMDFDGDRVMSGNVEERGTPRREVAWRGEIVRTEPMKRPRAIGTIGDAAALMALIKLDDWNQIHIIARGNMITHIINGQVMAILIDDDPTFFTPKGLLGMSIEGGALGRVSLRNVWLKKF